MLFLCAGLAQGCSLIDDDLSVCGTDFEMVLEMQLVTDLDLVLETTLSAETDVYTRAVLRNYFSDIFTDHAHDINIGFFSTDDELVYSIHDVIDATQSTYTFYLPKADYHAIATANLDNNQVVTLRDSADSRMARLETMAADTLPTQRTGLFTVARDIEVIDTADQKINLTLHMASCALALVIDTSAVPVSNIRAHMTNTANELMLRDSLFLHDRPKAVHLEKIEDTAAAAAAAQHYRPNKANLPNLANIASAEPSRRDFLLGCAAFPTPDDPAKDGSYYQVKVYVSLPNGTITETVLTPYESLQAGQLKILKLQLQPDGSVLPTTSNEVGASVTLEWKNGGEYPIDI